MVMLTTLHDGDKKIIQEIITMYDRLHPTGLDSIAASVVTAKHEQAQLELERKISSKTGIIKGSESNRRMTVSMPDHLYVMLIKKYPSLFKTEIKWFKHNFPMFVIEKQKGF